MTIKSDGRALVSNAEDGTLYEIHASDLEWEVIDTHDRSMGTEVLHRASIHHDDLGEISWLVSEYPRQFISHVTRDAGKHRILEDLTFWYQHEWDADDFGSVERAPVEISTPDLMRAPQEKQIDMLVSWFLSRYQDPSHETPYDGREGGFQYVWGGPYVASEELRDNFSDVLGDEIIDAAVDIIESDGTDEWAPIMYGPPENEDELFNQPTIADFASRIKAGAQTNPETPEILTSQAEVLSAAEALLTDLRASRPTHGGMGHNGPPIDDAGNILPPSFYEDLEAAAQNIHETFSQSEPDLAIAAEAGALLESRLSWLSPPPLSHPSKVDETNAPRIEKSNKFIDAYLEQLGKNAADITTNMGTAAASVGIGFILDAIFPGLHILVYSLITYLGLKITL